MVAEDAPADAQHHRAVTPDQGREGDLGVRVAPRHESLHELAVRQSDDCPRIEGDIDLSKDQSTCPGIADPSSFYLVSMHVMSRGPIVPFLRISAKQNTSQCGRSTPPVPCDLHFR